MFGYRAGWRSAAALRAVFHVHPVARPFLAPDEGPTTHYAELSRQISLATHSSHGITKAPAGRASRKTRRWHPP